MSDQDYDSDHEVSTEHSKLLEAVSKLDKGQRVKNPSRNEPSIQVSEFHLVKSGVTEKDAVHLDDLLKTLQSKPHHRDITKKLKSSRQKAKVLRKPLEKPQAEKLKREVGYENAKKEVQRWDAIITRNRAAQHLKFPLSQPSFIEKTTTDEFVKRFRIQSDLEKELEALDPKKPKENEDESKENDFPLTLAEILQRRREASKFRAQQSYREAKAHRQNKIKSKKFHRIQRKEKIKQQLKEFEQLQKTDPEAALEKLEQLDKARAEERMSLRHKSTGQWARNKQVRAKYDTESRKVLAQQLSISKELTQKVRKSGDDSEDEEEEVRGKGADGENPWTKSETEIDEFISGYRKFWEEKNKNKGKGGEERKVDDDGDADVPEVRNPVEEVIEESQDENEGEEKVEKSISKKGTLKKKRENSGKKSNKIIKSKAKFTSQWAVETFPTFVDSDSSDVEIDEIFERMEERMQRRVNKKVKKVKQNLKKMEKSLKGEGKVEEKKNGDDLPDLEFKTRKLRPEFNQPMEETLAGSSSTQALAENGLSHAINEIRGEKGVKRSAEIDPTKFIAVKPKHLKTQLPDNVMGGGEEAMDDDDDEDEAQHNIISEAFADDDVVDEFKKEKENEMKKSEPEDIDLRLPGWGTWGGKNIKINPRKKRRFILKFPKEAPRKDENKGDVIIIEDGNTKIKNHLVTEIPYPFTSVADYEASIRGPIGRNFVPENAHKRLTEPTIKTKLGAIIAPMDEDVLLKRDIKIRGKIQKNQEKKKNKENVKDKKKIKNTKGDKKNVVGNSK